MFSLSFISHFVLRLRLNTVIIIIEKQFFAGGCYTTVFTDAKNSLSICVIYSTTVTTERNIGDQGEIHCVITYSGWCVFEADCNTSDHIATDWLSLTGANDHLMTPTSEGNLRYRSIAIPKLRVSLKQSPTSPPPPAIDEPPLIRCHGAIWRRDRQLVWISGAKYSGVWLERTSWLRCADDLYICRIRSRFGCRMLTRLALILELTHVEPQIYDQQGDCMLSNTNDGWTRTRWHQVNFPFDRHPTSFLRAAHSICTVTYFTVYILRSVD